MLGAQLCHALALRADAGVGGVDLLAQLALVGAKVFSADASVVELRSKALQLLALLLVLLLEPSGLAHRCLEAAVHCSGRRVGGGEFLTEGFDAVPCGSERRAGLLSSRTLSPPGADVLLLGCEFLQSVASGFEGTSCLDTPFADVL